MSQDRLRFIAVTKDPQISMASLSCGLAVALILVIFAGI